jgi:hypothetical protein
MADWVWRSMMTWFTQGMSMPSLNTPTVSK